MKKMINGLVTALQSLLSLVFLGSGGMKVLTPYDVLKTNPGMEWASDFSANSILAIGSVESLLAMGLLVTLFRSRVKKYASMLASGLALVMVGAAVTHLMRGEQIVPNVVLFGIACLVAVARKGRL
tara:strand:- start:449 stop:826 length:378 start_codon:yes stop_codon:yes gene_type:complete